MRTLVCATVLILASCSTVNNGPFGVPAEPRTIAIVGVTEAPGVESGASQSFMSREFQHLVRAKGDYGTLRSVEVEKAVNSVALGSYELMMGNFSRNGELIDRDLRVLSKALLPVRTALIARVEKNKVSPGKSYRVALRDKEGEILTDRERVVLSTTREMQLRVSIVNLANGDVFWSRIYRATPAAEASYIKYFGSSFSGSLTASLANTMSHGIRVPPNPPAPSSQATLRSLMREVVRNIPQ